MKPAKQQTDKKVSATTVKTNLPVENVQDGTDKTLLVEEVSEESHLHVAELSEEGKEELEKEKEEEEVKFYDDLNREETSVPSIDDNLIDSIKGSYIFNEIVSYGKQLVIKFPNEEDEYVISNEEAKKLLGL